MHVLEVQGNVVFDAIDYELEGELISQDILIDDGLVSHAHIENHLAIILLHLLLLFLGIDPAKAAVATIALLLSVSTIALLLSISTIARSAIAGSETSCTICAVAGLAV